MSAPRKGSTTSSSSQPALAPPDRSLRRKMSPNRLMKIQMNMNQKKNAIIEKMTSQKVTLAEPTELQPASTRAMSPNSGRNGRGPRSGRIDRLVMRMGLPRLVAGDDWGGDTA